MDIISILATIVGASSIAILANLFAEYINRFRSKQKISIKVEGQGYEYNISGLNKKELDDIVNKILELQRLPQVFISYARPDRKAAQEIAQKLRDQGFKTWLDSEQLKVGDSWTNELEESLTNSQWVLVLLSENTSNSFAVEQEIKKALELEKKLGRKMLLPALISGDSVPEIIADRVYADFRDETESEFEHLVETMKTVKLPPNSA